MSWDSVITLLGGVALFLFGMNIMGNGLEKMSGGRLERILERMTSSTGKGVLLGCLVTAVIQSSSATTVMVVGFVNAGIMKLTQAVGVIMGANIGTTATSLLLGLGDISGSSLLSLLKPEMLAPIISVVGVVLYTFIRSGKKHDIGQILLGFGVLFFGMLTMEQSMGGLSELEGFRNLMIAFSNPLFGLAIGAVMTGIIQSSSASVGILQALSASGAIPFSAAAPIILGQNIGTCVTALLSSIGASRNAKRAAFVHLYFNIIGSIVFLILLYGVHALFQLPFWDDMMTRSTIAMFHLTFNVVTTAILFPFSRLLVKLSIMTVRGDSSEPDYSSILDERFLSSPALALDMAQDAVISMSDMAISNFHGSVALLEHFDDRAFDHIAETETSMDKLEVHLNQYLLRLTDRDFTSAENMQHSELLHVIGDIERIGDYSINIAELAQRMAHENILFTQNARTELQALTRAVGDLLAMTRRCYAANDAAEAEHIEPLEETVDLMTEVLKSRHILRLKRGDCTIEGGALFLELLIDYERIADHCSNLALYIIQRNQTHDRAVLEFDMHAYAHHLHAEGSGEYNVLFAAYEKEYADAIRNLEP